MTDVLDARTQQLEEKVAPDKSILVLFSTTEYDKVKHWKEMDLSEKTKFTGYLTDQTQIGNKTWKEVKMFEQERLNEFFVSVLFIQLEVTLIYSILTCI